MFSKQICFPILPQGVSSDNPPPLTQPYTVVKIYNFLCYVENGNL